MDEPSVAETLIAIARDLQRIADSLDRLERTGALVHVDRILSATRYEGGNLHLVLTPDDEAATGAPR
jgi:hypothetical protein